MARRSDCSDGDIVLKKTAGGEEEEGTVMEWVVMAVNEAETILNCVSQPRKCFPVSVIMIINISQRADYSI